MNASTDLPRGYDAPQEDEIDLAQLWNILYNGKWIIITFVIVALLAGMAYLFVTPPVYRANALIQVQSEEPPGALKGLMEATSIATGVKMGTQAATQMQIIKSRSVLGDVVDKRSLTVTAKPKYFPLVGEPLAKRNDQESDPQQSPVAADAGNWLTRYAWGSTKVVISALAVPEQFNGQDRKSVV